MTHNNARSSSAPGSADMTSSEADIKAAQKLLKTESDALLALSHGLGREFAAAVVLLSGIEGRVIVTGMGKSGHVGCKIASTMASTGTPSFFVHLGEASHGDLGMIVDGDVVLAMSNSGETAELAAIISHTSRFSIPLIGMTSKPESALAKASDVALILPDSPEACPMGLAPTTSTTLMLALGDALSVALLERKQFSPADFHVLHPGGKLGSRLLKVSDLMHTGDQLPLSPEATLMSEAIVEMTSKSFGCLGVTGEDGKITGVITDGDLRRHMSAQMMSQTVREVMTTGARTTDPDAMATHALAVMNSLKITTLFVLKDERPVGILHIHDCLRAGVA